MSCIHKYIYMYFTCKATTVVKTQIYMLDLHDIKDQLQAGFLFSTSNLQTVFSAGKKQLVFFSPGSAKNCLIHLKLPTFQCSDS